MSIARLKDGTSYTGNQQYKGVGEGMGIVKWCAICGTHKPQAGGRIKFVLGGRHWVCAKHDKGEK